MPVVRCTAVSAKEVAQSAAAAYIDLRSSGWSTAPARIDDSSFPTQFDCSREVAESPPCMAEGVRQGSSQTGSEWADESLICSEVSWRVRASFVVAQCELIMPVLTPSPSPEVRPYQLSVSEMRTLLAKRNSTHKSLPAVVRRKPSATFQLTKMAPTSVDVSPSLPFWWSRVASNAHECLTTSMPTFLINTQRQAGGLQEEASSTAQEALKALFPPVFVFSSSLALSYYAECRPVNRTCDLQFSEGYSGLSGDSTRKEAESSQRHTITRLLCDAKNIHAYLLESPGCLKTKEDLIYLVDRAKSLVSPPTRENQNLQRSSESPRPSGFGDPGALAVTLLDIRQLLTPSRHDKVGEAVQGSFRGLFLPMRSMSRLVAPNFGPRHGLVQHRCATSSRAITSRQNRRELHCQTVIDGWRIRIEALYREATPARAAANAASERQLVRPLSHIVLEGKGDYPMATSARHHCTTSDELLGLGVSKGHWASFEALIELDPLRVSSELDLDIVMMPGGAAQWPTTVGQL